MTSVGHCDRCGFDRSEWDEQDADRTLLHAELFLDLWSSGAGGHLAERLRGRRVDDLKAIDAAADRYDRVHHLFHGLVSIADVRRAAGDSVRTQSGTIAALHRSDGGVPKSPVDGVHVGRRGLDGDVQATRLHHGRPWQALCLWSSEVIEELATAGHPIGPGSAGENVTIAGVDWSSLRAGTVVDLGAVRCQLSAPAVPCSKNAQWFSDGDVSRIHHEVDPGMTRWYASVLSIGDVAVGDAVTVSPTG